MALNAFAAASIWRSAWRGLRGRSRPGARAWRWLGDWSHSAWEFSMIWCWRWSAWPRATWSQRLDEGGSAEMRRVASAFNLAVQNSARRAEDLKQSSLKTAASGDRPTRVARTGHGDPGDGTRLDHHHRLPRQDPRIQRGSRGHVRIQGLPGDRPEPRRIDRAGATARAVSPRTGTLSGDRRRAHSGQARRNAGPARQRRGVSRRSGDRRQPTPRVDLLHRHDPRPDRSQAGREGAGPRRDVRQADGLAQPDAAPGPGAAGPGPGPPLATGCSP